MRNTSIGNGGNWRRTANTSMRVRVSLTLEINPEDWMRAFGIVRSAVREDVKTYVHNLVQQAEVFDRDRGECPANVWEGRSGE
jgi:hypothetical protein